MASTPSALLSADDPPPVLVDNPSGRSPFLFIGDHAGNAIPAQLQNLGLDRPALGQHIAWDIGIRQLGRCLAEGMDAPFIHQAYSRLVIDCNRGPNQPDAILAESDGTTIAGNHELDQAAVAARIAEIHQPYHGAIAAELADRDRGGRPTVLVALHSFTPHMSGFRRPWQVGILHDRGDTSFAHCLLERLRASADLCVGDNEPYQMDGTDYTVPLHAYQRAIPYAEIEIRQDLLEDASGVRHWCRLLQDRLAAAHRAAIGDSAA